jgi:hypothetical protein
LTEFGFVQCSDSTGMRFDLDRKCSFLAQASIARRFAVSLAGFAYDLVRRWFERGVIAVAHVRASGE